MGGLHSGFFGNTFERPSYMHSEKWKVILTVFQIRGRTKLFVFVEIQMHDGCSMIVSSLSVKTQ